MSKGEPGLFVEYCAKDFLDGTLQLDPWEELAYRRICDMIYSTNNRLRDDDRMLAWATKAGKRWPKIKIALTTGNKPKLEIINGLVTNPRCTYALGIAAQKMSQLSHAGRASAATGKSLKNLNRSGTSVASSVPNGALNERPNGRSNEPLNHLTNIEKKDSEAKASATADAAAAQNDPVKRLWDRGLAILLAGDLPEARARRVIGGWRREFRDAAVMSAITACELEEASDPVSFISGCLQHSRNGANGHERLTPANKRFLAGREATLRAVLEAEERDREANASYEARDCS